MIVGRGIRGGLAYICNTSPSSYTLRKTQYITARRRIVFFEYIQIDLIDMITILDGKYKCILHIVNYFLKISSSFAAFALRRKHAAEFVEQLAL